MNKIKVFLICSGLGEVNRGYESFTRECFDVLSDEPSLEMYLFKGGGKTNKHQREYCLLNMKRRYGISRILATIAHKDSYFFEQVTFFVSLVPHILDKKPDVIYFSDFLIGCWLAHLKKFLSLKYKLLFSNGAPNGPPFPLFDHVQHLVNIHHTLAQAANEPMQKHSVVPYGFDIKENKKYLLNEEEKRVLRCQLGLPANKKIILSVGNVNIAHKRMDYLIKEFVQLSQQMPVYLLILGHISEESKPVVQLAQTLLGKRDYQIKTVPYKDIAQYYQAADIFVLCSLNEGFGRVYLEALLHGLPVFSHDFPVAREVLKGYGNFANLEHPHVLSKMLTQYFEKSSEQVLAAQQRKNYVLQHYSWSELKSKYIFLIRSLSDNRSVCN